MSSSIRDDCAACDDRGEGWRAACCIGEERICVLRGMQIALGVALRRGDAHHRLPRQCSQRELWRALVPAGTCAVERRSRVLPILLRVISGRGGEIEYWMEGTSAVCTGSRRGWSGKARQASTRQRITRPISRRGGGGP